MQLLSSGEVTPGVQEAEYEARRTAFLNALPTTNIALLPAAAGAYMAGHIPFPYRQVSSAFLVFFARFSILCKFWREAGYLATLSNGVLSWHKCF